MSYKSVKLLKEYLESATKEELEQDILVISGIEFDGLTIDEFVLSLWSTYAANKRSLN